MEPWEETWEVVIPDDGRLNGYVHTACIHTDVIDVETGEPGSHAEDCGWVRVMRKAGVVE